MMKNTFNLRLFIIGLFSVIIRKSTIKTECGFTAECIVGLKIDNINHRYYRLCLSFWKFRAPIHECICRWRVFAEGGLEVRARRMARFSEYVRNASTLSRPIEGDRSEALAKY
jgi:hypothetical protein